VDWNAIALVLTGALGTLAAGVALEWMRHQRERGQRDYDQKRAAVTNFAASASRLYLAPRVLLHDEVLEGSAVWAFTDPRRDALISAAADAQLNLSALRVFCPDLALSAESLYEVASAAERSRTEWLARLQDFEAAARKTLDVG
jgi:hypothetical protein